MLPTSRFMDSATAANEPTEPVCTFVPLTMTRTIYSDNGTKFQGAANQLRGVYKRLQSPSQMAKVQDFLATEGCDWNFIRPHAPHFGGLWEAAVKSMKYHLRRTLGPRIPTYEELCTLLTEIEACLNSRPLCPL